MVDQGNSPEGSTLSAQLFSGALWMFAMRWTMRLLGIVSVAVLARLLETDDFGLVAMASAVIALPTVLLDVGVEQAVIRERDPTRDVYNTAWTIRVLQMTVVAAIVFLFGPWIAEYYGDPRMVAMVQVLAVMVILNGLENIWIVSFRKNLQFQRDFAYNAACKLLAVIVTIALAFHLRSYWALVYGQAAAAAIRVIVSLVVAPERPVPTLRDWRRIWGFSQWALVGGVARYILENADRLILGRLTGAGAVGAYSVGREIAEMPISEISMPANRALGPGFATLQHDPQRLCRAFAHVIGAVAIVVCPIAVGLAATSAQAVPLLLGEGWDAAVPILQIVSLASIFAAIDGITGNALTVIGFIRTDSFTLWFRALLLLATGIPGAVYFGPEGMAAAFLVTHATGLVLMLGLFRRRVSALKIADIGRALVRPVVSVLVMLGVVLPIDLVGLTDPVGLLSCKVAAGGIAYLTTLYFLWRASGRPEGLEKIVVQRVGAIARRAVPG